MPQRIFYEKVKIPKPNGQFLQDLLDTSINV